MSFEIAIIPCRVGELNNYGYLIKNTKTGTVFAIDAPEFGPLEQALKAREWHLDYILITHHHHDHVEAIDKFRDIYALKVIGSLADKERLPNCDLYVEDTQTFSELGTEAHVIDSSGHTLNHLSYYFPDEACLFTGDSLMVCGCGRLFEGTPAMMLNTFNKFKNLPQNTLVYSGHEYSEVNLRFSSGIDPQNERLKLRWRNAVENLKLGQPTVPVSLEEEFATNPYFRTSDQYLRKALNMEEGDDVAVFAKIRALRDQFS